MAIAYIDSIQEYGFYFINSPQVLNILTASVCMNEYFWYLLECDCCRNMAKMQDLIWIFNKSLCKLCWFSQTKMCICFLPPACYSYNNRKKYILLEIEIFPSNLCWYSQLRQSSILHAESQCPRMDLSKRFLPKQMTTTGWKGTP